MRSAQKQSNHDFTADLTLSEDAFRNKQGAAHPAQVTAAWQNFVGVATGGVCLLRNVTTARQLLVKAFAAAESPVYLPANATHALVEDLKRTEAKLHFGALDERLNLTHTARAKVSWAEPISGLPTGSQGEADYKVIDHAATVATPSPLGVNENDADIQIYSLYLSDDANTAGALIVFRDATLADTFRSHMTPADEPDWDRAAHQLERLFKHLPRHQAQLATLHQALTEATGLPLFPLRDVRAVTALPHGIAVKIPDECAPATFYHYACGENTPVSWLPFARPLHPAAVAASRQCASATAAHLEPWVLAPLGWDTSSEMLSQTVLGIVKAAEFLGIRWRTNPVRAAAYAAMLDKRYGPGHDAYRPIFPIPSSALTLGKSTETISDFTPPSCRIPNV